MEDKRWGFFTPKNLDFPQPWQVLAGIMKQLTTSGVGAKTKEPQPFTSEKEDILWAEVEITVGHETISDHLACLSHQILLCSDILSLQKINMTKKNEI